MKRLVFFIVVLAAACASTGPTAPPPGAPVVACVDDVCLTYPEDWDATPGEGYIGFTHPAAPDRAVATMSMVNMEGVVRAAEGEWPVPPEGVTRSFWQLLEEADVAGFIRLERRAGGSVESFGSYEDGRLWFLLVPLDSTRAIGIEVRGPNNTWATHAEVFFSDVTTG